MRDLRRLVLTAMAVRAVAVAIHLVGYAKTRRMLRGLSPLPVGPREKEDGPLRVVREVAAAARGPLTPGCLPRALVAATLLAREGVPVIVRVGVCREGDRLRAHAWIEHEGVPVAEPPDVASRFAPFDRDFGGDEAWVR